VYTKNQQVVCFSKTCCFLLWIEMKNEIQNQKQAGDGPLFFNHLRKYRAIICSFMTSTLELLNFSAGGGEK